MLIESLPPDFAITLSDPKCVLRNRDAMAHKIREANIVFGNVKEMAAYSGTTTDEGIELIASMMVLAVCTRSSKPAVGQLAGVRFEVPVAPVEHVIDTTGAGDQFAAGFLHATSLGANAVETMKAGIRAAGRIIQQAGARPPAPEAPLRYVSQIGC